MINTLVIVSSLALSAFDAHPNVIAIWALADAPAAAAPSSAPSAPPLSPAPPAAPPAPAPPATSSTPEAVVPAVPPPTGVPPEAPAPEPPPAAATQAQVPAVAPVELGKRDEVRNAGYLPGYRTQQSLSLSPFAPTVGALPGGVTPGFGAPMPFTQWTFRFSGFFTATLQGSLNRREVTGEGQRGVIYHAPPQTLDEYGSFVGTSTMPGQWVALNLSYGNPIVSANISLNTWNPSAPSTYYQIGSQYFINNAFLRFDIPDFGALKLRANVGYFYNFYGNLAQYGPGMYTQSIIGAPRGVGESVSGEYRVSAALTLTIEDGLMGTRGGKVPDGVVPTGGNGGQNPIFPAAYVHHLHLGAAHTGDHPYRVGLHWMTNWAQDDRAQRAADNPTTHFVDEAYIRDGRIDVLGVDATVQDRTWGYLGAAASYTRGDNASVLRGMQTFAGTDGQALADRWFGGSTSGTGKLFAGGLNYNLSLGRVLSGANGFSNEQPDLLLNVGFIVAYTLASPVILPGATTVASDDVAIFNHRLRYKFGVDALYSFLSWMSAGLRVDRVAPNSKDAEETFYVLAPRVVFKRSWNSHESITLLYAKWFYGPHSHSEAGSLVPTDIGLDDQLVALNVNLYW